MDGMIFNKSEEADEKHAARRIVRDWSIIGVVPASAVESCMNAVQANTIMLLLALFAAILFGMSKIFHDESKMRRERAEAEKQELANTDALTGLLNKRYFDAVVGALERRRQAFAVFYLDLDRFKPVNDTYGHAMGDRLLQEVGKRLQGCIRSSDYAFRLGGDEFALLLVGELSAEDCRRKAAKVCIAVAEVYRLDGHDIYIGTSCGWSLFPAECPSAEQARLLADKRMYADKRRRHALRDHDLRED